jgi:GNAT superfamily N-acetyltransferase
VRFKFSFVQLIAAAPDPMANTMATGAATTKGIALSTTDRRSLTYRISTDRSRLDVPLIHRFLSLESSWARTVPLHVVERSIARSLCFGLYQSERQLGFARVVTDAATFGYVADLFIVTSARGLGLGRRLIEAVLSHPDLQGLRHFLLATRDCQQFDFSTLSQPPALMQMQQPQGRSTMRSAQLAVG